MWRTYDVYIQVMAEGQRSRIETVQVEARSKTEAIITGGAGTSPALTDKGRRSNAIVHAELRD